MENANSKIWIGRKSIKRLEGKLSLKEISKKAQRIDIRKLTLSVAQSNAELISDNVRDQLEKGIAGDESEVGRYTSTPYAIRKSATSKAPFGVVNLFVEGDLYKGITTRIFPTQVLTNSLVEHSKYQVRRYGKRIYENTSKNKEKVRDKNSRDAVSTYSRLLGV